jgi:hypothetical protein
MSALCGAIELSMPYLLAMQMHYDASSLKRKSSSVKMQARVGLKFFRLLIAVR